jgi:hypothetical protein
MAQFLRAFNAIGGKHLAAKGAAVYGKDSA